MDGVIEATHNLNNIPGSSAGFIPSLPTTDEKFEPLDFSDSAFEQVRNATSGIAHAFGEFQRGAQALLADPSFDQYKPAYRAQKLAEARAVVATESLKTIQRCETIAANAEKEAGEIRSGLLGISKVDPGASRPVIAAYQELKPEARVEMLHRLAGMLADPGADPRALKDARDYLAAICAVNPFAGLIPEATRSHVTEVMGRTKNPALWAKARHLDIAARAIRDAGARARSLIGGQTDIGARLLRS